MANQEVRFSGEKGDDNNPLCINLQYKPGRWISGITGVPSDSIGEIYDEAVNDVGVLYVKNEHGHWDAIVNFNAVIIPSDPIVVNSIHTNEIQTDNSGAVQINLQTSDLLNIGPSTDLTAIQFQSNGVISSNAAAGTSSLSLGSAGNQLTMDPSILTIAGSPDLNLFASNNAVITANAGSITAQCGTTVDVSAPSGMTIATFGSGVFLNDGGGTILKVLPNSIEQQGAGDLAINSANNLNLTSTGTLTLTSGAANQILLAPGGGAVVEVTPGANFVTSNIFSPTSFDITTAGGSITAGASTSVSFTGATSASLIASGANVTIQSVTSDINLLAGGTITSSVPFYSGAGSAGAPTYSFSSDSNSGVSSLGADIVGISTGGSTRMFVENADVTFAAHALPFVDNTYDLGSAAPQLAYRNIYSNNLLNVVSDGNKKENVEEIGSSLKFINKLVPVTFQFKGHSESDSKKKVGFIAQQCEMALNDSGFKSDDLDIVVKSEAGDYLMKYDTILSFLVKSVQELNEKIRILEAK